VLLVEGLDQLAEAAVDAVEPPAQAVAFRRVEVLRDVLELGIEVLELERMRVADLLLAALAQALQELMECPGGAEAVRGVGVAAMDGAELLNGIHGSLGWGPRVRILPRISCNRGAGDPRREDRCRPPGGREGL